MELKAGVFQPADCSFNTIYSDLGPIVGGEIDALLYRIPYVGPLGFGVGASWARYSGRALTDTGAESVCNGGSSSAADIADDQSTESTTLRIFPISTLAVLRVDALARELNVPFVFGLKLGLDTVPWVAKKGGERQGNGVTFGMHWAAQIGLELDFLERQSAKRLDSEWGINHTMLFFELFGSLADSSFPLDNAFAWRAGLSLTF